MARILLVLLLAVVAVQFADLAAAANCWDIGSTLCPPYVAKLGGKCPPNVQPWCQRSCGLCGDTTTDMPPF